MKNILLVLIAFLILSCSQQKARKPVSHSEGSFMKESVERNKKLIALEEKAIDSIIKSNPKINYLASKKGYWYHYINKNATDTISPKRGDFAYFDYDVKDLKGNIIYTNEELKPQIYNVDKQNIMIGLRDAIKIMRKNEKIVFLFPSNLAYGYHGDNNKIETNEPIICTVTLNEIKTEEQNSKIIKPSKLKETKPVFVPKEPEKQEMQPIIKSKIVNQAK